MTNIEEKPNLFQGKKAKAIYPYKANFNDELAFKSDDVITIIQPSDDGTWLEGTLGSRSGWFPSNYVQIFEDEIKIDTNDHNLRIEAIIELKKAEELFIDEINKFLKFILIPLQVSSEAILSVQVLDQIQNSIDDLVKIHRILQQQLSEITENSDGKIGGIFMTLAPTFKSIYEAYSKANPKYINAFNKERDNLNKYFESNKNLTQSAILYMSKSLSLPFKQLEVYVRLLKDIHRATQDFHADRGDVQRAIEFYDDLTVSTTEYRKKKDYELEIMSTKIKNYEENLFADGESIFLSNVLVIYDNNEKKDQILMLFPTQLVLLSQTPNKSTSGSNELNFESRINLINNLIQVSPVDLTNDGYKYCFEISGPAMPHMKLVCSSAYDQKSWVELLTAITAKTQLLQNIKTQTLPKAAKLLKANDSQRSFVKPTTSPAQQSQQQVNLSVSPTTPSTAPTRKPFSMRPHPPLQTQFHAPNDNTNTTVDGTGTIKRQMYKKPQLSEPTGKYHGADDDLKLLNVIETYWKAKIRQSLNVNVQEAVTSLVNKSAILPPPQKIEQDHIINLNKKSTDDKYNRLESHIQILSSELSELKKTNKDLKQNNSNLQKQLEREKVSRKKLEQFIRKNNKTIDITSITSNEVESTI